MTCGRDCRTMASVDKKTAAVVTISQVCRYCGVTFNKPYYAQHCSLSCASIAKNRLKKTEPDKYEPKFTDETLFDATDAPPGSREKVDILRQRMESGFPLWHSLDRVDFAGLTGQ